MNSATPDCFLNNKQTPCKNPLNGFKYSLEQDSLSQDLHFKMSKKIAQLTKVIYALNTKNDDHEASLSTLKAKHSQDVQQVLDETNTRVEQLEQRLASQSSQSQRLLELQQVASSYESLLQETRKKFEQFQTETSKTTKEKDLKHTEQMECLREQVKSLKSSYEQLMEEYYTMDKRIEKDKKAELDKLKVDHDNEMEQLKEEFKIKEQQLRGLISGSQHELELQLSRAQEDVRLISCKKEEIERNYENQVHEMRRALTIVKEEAAESKKVLEFEIEEQKARFHMVSQQAEQSSDQALSSQKQLSTELVEKCAIITELREQVKKFSSDLKEREASISKQSEENLRQTKFIHKLESEIKVKIEEIAKIQAKNENQSQEMAAQLKQIKESKTTVEQLQKRLSDKDLDLKKALGQISIMNEESKEMENYSKSFSTNYEIQIQTLHRGLEDLTQERNNERSALERMKLSHEIELLESISKIKKESEFEMEKMTKKRDKEISVREKSHQEEIQKMKDESQANLDEERAKASKIIEKLKGEIEQVKSEIAVKIKAKDKQISGLEGSLLTKEKELKANNLQFKETKESVLTMKKDIQKLNKMISDKDTEIQNLLDELKEFKSLLEEQKSINEDIKKRLQVQNDTNEKYNKLSAELDRKWADTLRKETGRVRNDLLENLGKEKQKAVEKLEMEKNCEIESIKNNYQSETTKLLEDVSNVQKELETLRQERDQLKATIDSLTTNQIQEVQSLLSDSEKSHTKEISALKSSYSTKIEKLKKKFDNERLAYMSEMQLAMEESQRHLTVKHEDLIRFVTSDLEKKMKMKLDDSENKYSVQLSEKIKELQSEMSNKTKLLDEEHKEEIKELQMKITGLENQSKSGENQSRLEMERSTSEKTKLEFANQHLESQLQNLLTENGYLKKQVDDFASDYHRYQKEFSENLKTQEMELRKTHEQIAQNTKSKYEDEAKQVLTDFNKAQNLYKAKITELNSKLMEIEDKYVNRPSRDEDVDVIETLKAQLRATEKEVEKLNEEKRFIQLELVNRDTNYNKLFNGSLNIGSKPSGQEAIKSRKISGDKMKAFQKLTPLPGSPFHDDPINPTKPLPPSARRSSEN